MFQTKIVQKVKMFNKFYAVYEKMRKNAVEPDRPQMTILRIRFACWITKDTDIHLEYVILIDFLRQQWLSECVVSMFLYSTLPVLL